MHVINRLCADLNLFVKNVNRNNCDVRKGRKLAKARQRFLIYNRLVPLPSLKESPVAPMSENGNMPRPCMQRCSANRAICGVDGGNV